MRKALRRAYIVVCWPVLAFKQGKVLAKKRDRFRRVFARAFYLESAAGVATSLGGVAILVVLIRDGARFISLWDLFMFCFTAYTWRYYYRGYRLDRQVIRDDRVFMRKFQRT